MTMGTPRVDLATLIELNRLVSGGCKAAPFRSGRRITQEDHDEIPQYAGAGVGPAARPDIKTRMLDGLSDKDRKKAISTLACLLIQAAGLVVEELNDDQH
ncbi:hypothetical protein [Sinorhizobium meliloti]|uniref:hypothetical protein n=1 Tax=Rhizobium meliloti TaxID=382 RepID=UPI00299DCF09